MNSKKIISLVLISSLFLTGCSPFTSEDENIETSPTPEPLPKVVVEESIRTSFTPELSLSGTITAKDEVTIASEVTGTVSKVVKNEGDAIKEGTTLMKLEAGTNLLNASYASAKSALANSSKALAITKRSSAQDIANANLAVKNAEIALKNAQISVDNAEIAYNRVKDSEKFQTNTQAAQTQGSEKSVEIAEKNLEIAQQTLADTMENEVRIEINLIENIANTISSVLIPLRSNMTFADSLLGASELRKNDNDSFEVFLVGTTQGVMQESTDLWNQTDPQLEELEIRFQAIDRIKYIQSDREELETILSTTLSLSKVVRKILRNIEEMLYGSIVSTTFTQTTIDAYKSQVSSAQQGIEANIQTITALQQSLLDFDTQSPQRITNAQLNVSVMESQLASSKDALLAAENSESSSNVNISSDLQNAKNAYLNAENAYLTAENALASSKAQVESVKIQGELSKQTAIAQMDSAQATMDQASLNLSKLTINSGITGTVSQVLAFDGDTVSPGTPLVVISDFSQLKLVSDVSVEESFVLKEGMKASVSIEGVADVFAGQISLVSPEADKTTRRVRVEILIPNKKSIPANVFATANIELEREKPQVYIPTSALVSENPPTIFVVEDNAEGKHVLVKKELELGEEKENMVAVTKGLRPKELVVSEKYRALFEGDEVIPQQEGQQDEEEQEEINTPATPQADKNTPQEVEESTQNNASTPAPSPAVETDASSSEAERDIPLAPDSEGENTVT